DKYVTSLHRLKSPRATDPNTTSATTPASGSSEAANRSARPTSARRSPARASMIRGRRPSSLRLLCGQHLVPYVVDPGEHQLGVGDGIVGIGSGELVRRSPEGRASA